MKPIHLPSLGGRYWTALCLASIFGANMGDFFANNLGLGHGGGLPLLAVALAVTLATERYDGRRHQAYYWSAIIIVRTAATNVADLASVDLSLSRGWVMVVLIFLLLFAVWARRQFAWRRGADNPDVTLCIDAGYWACMFLAGTLGTEIGDYCSHSLKLGDARAALLLSSVLAALFLIGRRDRILLLPVYWSSVVMIRAAGTAVGDYLAARPTIGLPLSTAVTGFAFVGLLLIWNETAKPDHVADGLGDRVL